MTQLYEAFCARLPLRARGLLFRLEILACLNGPALCAPAPPLNVVFKTLLGR